MLLISVSEAVNICLEDHIS